MYKLKTSKAFDKFLDKHRDLSSTIIAKLELIAQKVKSNMSLIHKIKEDFAKMQENLINDIFKE